MEIDYGYVANLEELQRVTDLLTQAAMADFDDRCGNRTFDPSAVERVGGQLRLGLEVKLAENGDPIYSLTIQTF